MSHADFHDAPSVRNESLQKASRDLGRAGPPTPCRGLDDLPRHEQPSEYTRHVHKLAEDLGGGPVLDTFEGHAPKDVQHANNPGLFLKSKHDPIFQPAYYARYVIEPITFINANNLGFNIGSVIKYACRYDAKNGIEDLKKARRYLDIQIEVMERAARIDKGADPKAVWSVMI